MHRTAASPEHSFPLDRFLGLNRMPDEVAHKMVAALYKQPASQILSAIITVSFGLVCFWGTTTGWYLVGACYAAVVATWRYAQAVAFQRIGPNQNSAYWARRNLYSGWATALGWAAWTIAIPCEPDPAVGAIVLGLHAGLTSAGAIRNGTVPAVAVGQIIIATPPLALACLVASSPYLHLYAAVVVMYSLASLAMTKFIYDQTREVFLSHQKANDLAAELALLNDCLTEQATIDPLTNLLNRRALDLAASREWRIAVRDRLPISVLMIDIDFFKKFNDHYGHQTGDQCLRDFASVLKSVMRRPCDIVARFGGEEFIAILPLVDAEGAATVAANVLERLATCAFPHEAAPRGVVSASIGIAGYSGSTVGSVTELIALADAALYIAKRGGRNRLVINTDLKPAVLKAELVADMMPAHDRALPAGGLD